MPLADRPLPAPKGDRMRIRLGVISVGIIVALALLASGAQATGGGRVASACSNETVNGGRYVGKLTIRLGLVGRVSCDEAHRVIRTYFREMSAGHCGVQNNFCDLVLPGGWGCSIFPAAEEKETSGAFVGCYEMATGAKIRVYKVSRPKSKPGVLHLREFLSPDRRVWCQINNFSPPTAACGTHPEPPTHAAEVDGTGHVSLCSVPRLEYAPGAHVPNTCFQNWAEPAVLHEGQKTELNGFRCSSAVNGITCTVVAGVGQGKGFRINRDEAVEVG
jgi:hypothetical protein